MAEMNHTPIACKDYDVMAWLWEVKGIEHIEDSGRKIRKGLMEYQYDIDGDEWVRLRAEYTKTKYPQFLHRMKLLKDPSF